MLRTAVLALGLAALVSGCATRYELKEPELQASINQNLPVARSFRLDAAVDASVAVNSLEIRLPTHAAERIRIEARGQIATAFHGFTMRQDFNGEVRAGLRYEAQDHGIYLDAPEVTALDAPALAALLPRPVYAELLGLARARVTEALIQNPVYTVSDRTMAERLFRARGGDIELVDKKVVFHLN